MLTPLGVQLDEVAEKLRAGGQVRRTLRPWGRLNIDRALPFLFVYRRPAGAVDIRAETLVTTQASYLLAPGDPDVAREASQLAGALAGLFVEDFGACLIIELSIARGESRSGPHESYFRIVTRRDGEPRTTAAELEASLTRLVATDGDNGGSRVEIERRRIPSSAELAPLVDIRKPIRGCFVMGLELAPVYADAEGGGEFPLVHRRLRTELAGALKRTAFAFTTHRTTHHPAHYHALGRARFVKSVWEADRELAAISNRFDFLLLSTPRNADAAWMEFRRNWFDREPQFSYPPLPFDPALAKRDLYRVPLERIEDPTLEDLFREQQDELDRKITMLSDRGTPRFRYGSLQLFGTVDDALFRQAEQLLDRIPSRSREGGKSGRLDARAFAARAEAEIERLGGGEGRLPARVYIRDDVSSLIVSRGHLLVPARASIPTSRVEALLQHEVGTHVLTYYNGAAQPFRQLRNGLPGYDELQEGLAVLAEYLMGGLSRARLRILAARVVAVRRMIDGASFVEVFRELDRDYDFAQPTAYAVTMRVFRGGGQAKDAVYLRGLVSLLDYLAQDGDVEPFLVGKIGLRHLEMINDLQARDVLVTPPFRPRYLQEPQALARLAKIRRGVRVVDLARLDRRTQA